MVFQVREASQGSPSGGASDGQNPGWLGRSFWPVAAWIADRSRNITDAELAPTGGRWRWYPGLLAVLAFVLLPNLPYWLWLSRFTPTRAIINIDYLLLGILCPFLSRRLLILGFVFVAIIDAFVFVSTLYHFTPREFIFSMSYARYSPIKLSDLPLTDILPTIAVLAVAIWLGCAVNVVRRKSVSATLAVALAVIVLVDVLSGAHTFAPSTHLPFYSRVQRIKANPANSGLLAVDPASFVPSTSPPVMTPMDSASRIGLEQWRALPRRGSTIGRNFALVLVESWGEIDGSSGLTQSIAAPLLTPAIRARYDVHVGSIPFRGSTTNAELRELCGLHGSYRDLFRMPQLRCLPNIFVELGYQTTGMHGFHGDMFDRTSWWPRLGLQQNLFLDDFPKGRRCGSAFPALCDDNLLRVMGDRLTAPRQFVYALTINSHLPLPVAQDEDGGLRCSALSPQLRDAPCKLSQVVHSTLTAVASNALRNDIKPTQFVIVGDHSPPFLGSADQNFSVTKVPYIILTPRGR